MPVRRRTRSGEVFGEQRKSYFEIAATTVIALIVMTAGSALVVLDTLTKHHAHEHHSLTDLTQPQKIMCYRHPERIFSLRIRTKNSIFYKDPPLL